MAQEIDVAGLRVLVTAGAQGIGRTIAEAFISGGAQVHMCDQDPDLLAALIHEVPEVGVSVADVANEEQVQAFVAAAVSSMGGVDVLINNAGISGPAGPIETLDLASWNRTMEVNVAGMFLCMREVVPLMKAQRSGSIINISSTAGLFGYPNRAPYAASKWAVVGLTKSLAMEVGEFGVRVNTIAPGSINNPRMDYVIAIESDALGRDAGEVRANYERQVSMQTFIDPEEIANMAVFLASPLGAKISGQALAIDGHTETLRT